MICKYCQLQMVRDKDEKGKFSKCAKCKTVVYDKDGRGMGIIDVQVGNVYQNQGIKLGGK